MNEPYARASAPELDAVLGQKFPVLDDGFVVPVDYLGNDSAIVQAARVSYGAGTKKVHEDRGLIRYLMRHRHTTPFEMCEIKFHVRVPMDCWRQWIRHRTASVNEYSTRYSEAIDSCQVTPRDKWRAQSQTNKQGSAKFIGPDRGIFLSGQEQDLHKKAHEVYQQRLKVGVAREQARKDLPLSTYTEAYWKIDLHNLLHFLSLRMDSHAQFEIRQYANQIGELVKLWVPMAWEAFTDYRLGGITLYPHEQEMISVIAAGYSEEAMAMAHQLGWLDNQGNRNEKKRELLEFEDKAIKMRVELPWLF